MGIGDAITAVGSAVDKAEDEIQKTAENISEGVEGFQEKTKKKLKVDDNVNPAVLDKCKTADVQTKYINWVGIWKSISKITFPFTVNIVVNSPNFASILELLLGGFLGI